VDVEREAALSAPFLIFAAVEITFGSAGIGQLRDLIERQRSGINLHLSLYQRHGGVIQLVAELPAIPQPRS